MDDDDATVEPDAAAEISAVRAKDTHAHTMFKIMAGVALVGTLIIAGGMWWMAADSTQLRSTVSTLSGQQAYAATVGEQLASQLRAMGATPVESPPHPVSVEPGAAGAVGASGAPGPAGRGIASTVITGGHLVVAYTDGTTTDEGQVVGTDGVGITGSTVNSAGHLILTYSNGTVDDVGAVVGPAGATGATGTTGAAGCGIASVGEDTSSNLVVTYTSNCSTPGPTVVGPLPTGPSGPPGADGPPGQPPLSWTFKDELGTTQYCSRASSFDATNPTYTCSPTPPSN